MKPLVTIIDYGVGNIFSVSRAFEHCGAEVKLTAVPDEIAKAERLVLPGVGAFADGMSALRERGLVQPIQQFALTGRPFLGICLGMQMMFDSGEEFGHHAGLGLIHGKVISIPAIGADGRPHKIPHIGWNELTVPEGNDWSNTIFSNVRESACAYFVHSFHAVPDKPEDRLAECSYDGHILCAAVKSGSIIGCQFHPEKSQAAGLCILKNWISEKKG